jgi:hypothetical protein
MNTVGAATANTGVYMNLMLCCTFAEYVLCMPKHRSLLCHDHKTNTLITHCALQHCTKKSLHIHNVLQNELFPTTAVQQRQHVDAVGYRKSFKGLITMFVFDILQSPVRCIQIYSGALHPIAPFSMRAWSYLA